MERKRSTSHHKPPSFVETKHEEKPERASLVLKVPPAAKRQRISTALEDCLQSETAEECLTRLLAVKDVELTNLASDLEKTVGSLGEIWKKHASSEAACLMVLRLTTTLLLQAAKPLPQSAKELVVSFLEDADNTEVKIQALRCIGVVAKHHSGEALLQQKILQATQKESRSTKHHAVRVECVGLVEWLAEQAFTNSTAAVCGDLLLVENTVAFLEECSTDDDDPRVRAAALNALLSAHNCGIKLPLSVYHKAAMSIQDSMEDVREAALKIVWKMGLQNPDVMTDLKQDVTMHLRLVDDAFIKTCDMVNDISVRVRALATKLLGDFGAVSSKFLDQTLDKKLMSHLKVVKSEHERQKELHQTGKVRDWDTGKQWATSAPKPLVEPEEVNLVSSGACGAFVHSLEDEFMEVRLAAVDSMCRLSLASPLFGEQCLDFLVDLFDDEIQSVRLKAINSIRRISANIELREDQLETVLGVLEEACPEIREALHSLLSSSRITTTEGLNSTVHALLDSLKKYPHDRESVWRCLQRLGGNHGNLLSPLVPKLLSTHPFFMSKEPDMDDPAYICVLILVFNAARQCPTIPPLFPRHVFRHYSYLKDTLPALIPTIHVGIPSMVKLNTGSSQTADRRGALFMMEIFSRAQQAGSLPRLDAQKTWQCCVDDLLTIVELHTHLSATAQCAAMFLQSQLLINKVLEALSHGMLLSSDVPTQVGVSHITHCIKELLLHGYRLEHMFVDLPTHLVCGGRMVRVVAHCLQLLMNMNTEIKDRDLQKLKQTLIQRISTLARFCELHKLLLPSPVLPLVAMDTTLVANDVLVESLKPVVSNQFCTLVKFSELSNVQLCRAVVVEPHELGREDCVKFVSSLALCICVNATLYHVKDLCQVAVQVRFPDGKKLLFVPKPEEVREVGVTEHRLETSVIISHGMWTDACGVEFCVVLRHQTDVEEETSLVMEHMYTHKAKAGANSAQEGDTLGTLVISNRVMVTIYPQDTTAKGFNVFQ
ncbi:hypothetical protein EMCRGX_G026108 [Ephydatia muelleri]